jgi:hypothetical protein
MPDGLPEEFDEDASFPILDLSQASPWSPADAEFSHCMVDIDALLQELGIPWELSKDISFGMLVPYISFLWDLVSLMVSIPDTKKAKYLAAIASWESCPTHTLADIQSLRWQASPCLPHCPNGPCFPHQTGDYALNIPQ